jgi:oxygen-independent coproporphyrinogen III oxidase
VMSVRHLYVHVPFCSRRCTYCDFSIAVRRDVPVEEYLEALERELRLREFKAVLDTVYLGGGTPSRLGGAGIQRLMDLIRSCARVSDDAEVTIEANPEDVTAGNAQGWKHAGINRISLGSQSFSEEVLRWMHRVHDSARIPASVHVLRDAGFDNISLDLIFALPESLRRDWHDDLRRTLDLEPEHVSLYGLTFEPQTPLGRQRDRGEVMESPEERYAEEFLLAHETMTAAGLEHYEVSNFAKPGRRSRHNSSYWKRVAYEGLGPSAHAFDGRLRRWNIGPYAEWVDALSAGRAPLAGEELLAPQEVAAEEVYLGLRTVDGLKLRPEEVARVERWISQGWAILDGDVLRLTPDGWLRLDSLAADLTHSRSR